MTHTPVYFEYEKLENCKSNDQKNKYQIIRLTGKLSRIAKLLAA